MLSVSYILIILLFNQVYLITIFFLYTSVSTQENRVLQMKMHKIKGLNLVKMNNSCVYKLVDIGKQKYLKKKEESKRKLLNEKNVAEYSTNLLWSHLGLSILSLPVYNIIKDNLLI